MNKKSLTETDICMKYITPSLEKAGWDIHTQISREHYFTDGRIQVQGKLSTRGKGKKADYILSFGRDQMIAVIEAKDNNHSIGSGMQQAQEYAEILDIPFVFTSNGDGYMFYDKTAQSGPLITELSLEGFPSPKTLWEKYLAFKGIGEESKPVIEQPLFFGEGSYRPRYYQQIAINRTVEAIARGQQRILLVMATGTGKTFTAFNIVWKLWKSRRKKRILFLADRNALLTQTKNGDFSPFGNDIMTIVKNRKVDRSYQIYFALYQGLTGSEEDKNVYKQFSPDFFDLIIIDECHRGSAREASAWRDVLEYFTNATQIGLTATPKETEDVSNMAYFGEPIYTYSLKQGINDGFLAPYKVVKITTDVDEGWRPTSGLVDKYGLEVEDRIYNLKDYDRNLVIDERTQIVADKISEFLKKNDRFAKTIIFCTDIDHADRMRHALINANADLVRKHPHYIVKITGDDQVGKQELDNFIDVEEQFPVIATTSKMLTTGIDTKMVKLIVLESNIGSMTEFKQIIGRGTRLREKEGKTYFTIMDFRKNTNKFADPDFDGDPIPVEPKGGSKPKGTGTKEDNPEPYVAKEESEELPNIPKYHVNGIDVYVSTERVQYYGPDGKLITESLIQYTKSNVKKEFHTAAAFSNKWNAGKKKEFIDSLVDQGILVEALREEIGANYDVFDLICHVAYDMPPLTRKERAENVRKRNYFAKYGEQARTVLELLLDKYVDEGITVIEDTSVLRIAPLNSLGTPLELIKPFGGKKQDFENLIKELEYQLYNPTA